METSMERACCDDIVKVEGRVSALESWRDDHEERNNKSNERTFEKLDSIERKLTTWVNPVIAIVISVLTALLGIFGGVMWATMH